MKIEKPFWFLSFGFEGKKHDKIDRWFDEHVEPVNKMLAEGVEVWGYPPSESAKEDHIWGVQKDEHLTHKALLINIQPIKKETAEDVLKELVQNWSRTSGTDCDIGRLVDKAKAVLDETNS